MFSILRMISIPLKFKWSFCDDYLPSYISQKSWKIFTLLAEKNKEFNF